MNRLAASAIRLNERCGQARLALARVALLQDDPAQAIEELGTLPEDVYLRGPESDPTFAITYAEALLSLPSDAASHCREVQGLLYDVLAQDRMDEAARGDGTPEQAWLRLRLADINLLLGRARVGLNQKALAAINFQTALRLDPFAEAAYLGLQDTQ